MYLMFEFVYRLVNKVSYTVGCCIVDGWVDNWCTDVSWVWRKPNRNAAAALLPKNNLRNDQLLHRGLQFLLRHRSFTTQLTLPRATTLTS
jgi:hypothetical protein